MKVLMLNGSPKADGNTNRALTEIGEQLKKEGIDYEIFQIGGQAIRDCIGCNKCQGKGCIFNLILQEVSRLFRRRDELQVFLRARCHQKNNGFTS